MAAKEPAVEPGQVAYEAWRGPRVEVFGRWESLLASEKRSWAAAEAAASERAWDEGYASGYSHHSKRNPYRGARVMSDTQLEHEQNSLRDENVRLRHVVAVADAWRETLNLPQQDIGCAEFNEAFENYDTARSDIADLIPQARCREPGCDELTYLEGLCDEHHPETR